MTAADLSRVLYEALQQNGAGAYIGTFRFADTPYTCLDGDFDLEKVAQAVMNALTVTGKQC